MRFLILLLITCLGGCASPPSVTPSPTPDKLLNLVGAADKAFASSDFETAALKYRDALDLTEERGLSDERLSEKAAESMAEAGGFRDSHRIWTEMKRKNPDSAKEADRMLQRARQMMMTQADELKEQAKLDAEEGHQLKSQATTEAANLLIREAATEPEKKS